MSEQLYCGWGRTDITPKVPVSLAGYFNIRMSEKVLDRLEARAIVFKQGDKYAGIVNLDLISSAQILVDRVWKKIADLTMFSKENLIFCSTHTHTGPEIRSTVLSGSEECAEDIAGAISQALRNALKDLYERLRNSQDFTKLGYVFISHADCIEDAEYLQTMINEEYPEVQVIIGDIGPVIGAHTGPGGLAMCFLGKTVKGN